MISQKHFKAVVPGGDVHGIVCTPANDTARARMPLVVLHGGPGGSYKLQYEYLFELADDQPVIFYDQLGSDQSPAKITDDLIKPERFGSELAAVLDHLRIDEAVVLGHSWGGSVALEFALAHAGRTKGLILSSPLISSAQWIKDTNQLLTELPQATQDAIRTHEAAGTTESAEYKAAESVFMKRHYCRINPLPKKVIASFPLLNRALYYKMWGASEFHCDGTLKNYDRMKDLGKLNMPVLVLCGRYDEARPETMAKVANKIKNAEVYVLEDSAHAPYVEQTHAYKARVQQFLNHITP